MNRRACTLFCIALAASAAADARSLRDANGQPLGGGAREWPQTQSQPQTQRGAPERPQQERSAPPSPQQERGADRSAQPRNAPERTSQPRTVPERSMELHSGPLPHPPNAPPIAAPAGPPPQTLPVPRFGVERGREQPGQDAGQRNWAAPADPRRDERDWQRNERQVPRVVEPPRVVSPPRVVQQPRRVYQWRDYDRFRLQNFRFQDGRYFGRTRYRAGPYLWPRGFGVHLWLVGEWLPTAFYLDNQYQLDYWRFGLYEPPLGCRWVRVGNDALLVDDFNGEVLDAIYDLFW